MTHDAAEAAEPEASDGSPVNGLRRPSLGVYLLAAAMFASTLVFVSATPDDLDLGKPFGDLTFVVIMIMFGVAELSVFNVHFRRDSIAFALNEIPIAFAFTFLSPVEAPLARVPLTLLVLVFVRRNRPDKLAFNMSLHVFEVAFAGLVFHALVGFWGDGSIGVVVAVAAALMIVTPITSIVVTIAISMFDGNTRQRVVGELHATWWLYMVTSVLAAMTVALALFEPALTLLALLPILGMWYVLHAFGGVSQELRDLGTIHGFAGRIGDTLDVDDIGDVAVDSAMQMFRASGAVLVRFTDDGPGVHSTGELSLPPDASIDLEEWRALASDDGPVDLSRSQIVGLGMRCESSMPIALATSVDDGGEPLGVLTVARDDLQHEHFDEGDRARLHNIGRQLSVALRRGMLHEQLEWEARHDALTGLPARTLFELYVADATAAVDEGVWAVIMLDLDRFKEVNDTLGHHAGDELLVQFSRRMSAILDPQDSLARLAGDEFAILCCRPTTDEILEFAQMVMREGGKPVSLDGLEIVVTVSVGVAYINRHDRESIEPMRRADIAMYNAKWQRSGVELYRDDIDRRTPARLSMLGDLRTAIEENQLTVVYQPKLSLSTGALVGAEALLRWVHPHRGTVPPTEFVRVAEDTGLIKQLTDLVLANGIGQLAECQRAGLDIGLAVNLSTHDLFDSRLPDRVRGYLETHDVDPSRLTLEITESSLFVDAPRTRATIDGLHEVGLRMAVDDFGTGYSSLSYLRYLPVHELKIDQSFVERMLLDPQDEVIVRSTVELGHNLGLVVTAEGVESLDVLRKLRGMGCDIAQGFAISEPVPSTDLVEWMKSSDRRSWQNSLD